MTLIQKCREVVKNKPGLSCAQIAHELGIERSQFGYHGLSGTLSKLAKKGILDRKEDLSPFYRASTGIRCWRYYPNANT